MRYTRCGDLFLSAIALAAGVIFWLPLSVRSLVCPGTSVAGVQPQHTFLKPAWSCEHWTRATELRTRYSVRPACPVPRRPRRGLGELR